MHICCCLRLISAEHEIQVPDFFPRAWRRSVKDKNTVHGQTVVRLCLRPFLPSFLPPGQEGTGVAINSIMQAGCFWIVIRKRENNETVTPPAGVGQVRARSVLFFYTFFLFRSGTRERYLLSKTLPIFRVRRLVWWGGSVA